MEKDSSSHYILIIDDDQNQVNTLRDIFVLENLRVTAVTSAREALQLLEKETFHLVLSDIRMKEINGVELTRLVKRDYPDTPVILMTAYASENFILESIQAGALVTMSKPLDIPHLIDQVNRLLG